LWSVPAGQDDTKMPLFSSREGLLARFAKRLPELVDLTVVNLKRDVPFYEHLPAEVIDHEIVDVIQRNLRLFVTLLEEDRVPTLEEVAPLLNAVARRTEERMPLPDMLAAYHVGFRVAWEELVEMAEAGDVQDVLVIGRATLRYVEFITTAVTDTYVETATALISRVRDARTQLLTAVLEGTDVAEHWEDAGLTRWRDRTVVVLRHPLRRQSDPTMAAVAARRRARELRLAGEALAGPELLFSFSTTGGVMLLPGTVDAAALSKALGPLRRGRWYVGLAHAADGPATPGAHEAAQSCAEVAERLDYQPGIYELRQLLVEVQVTRPGVVREALLDVLHELEEHPELMETLTVHVAEAGRRTDTARRLHVHPNTLDYRLKRIREITGLDPVDRDGAQLLRSALLARTFVGNHRHQ